MRVGVAWRGVSATFAAGVAVLAATAVITEDVHYYLAAAVLTLPSGLFALVGVYLAYALSKGLGGLCEPTTTASGQDAKVMRVRAFRIARRVQFPTRL